VTGSALERFPQPLGERGIHSGRTSLFSKDQMAMRSQRYVEFHHEVFQRSSLWFGVRVISYLGR